jgi:D-alanine-D-alanine ligase
LLQQESIRTPDFQLLDEATLGDFHLNFPCIIKPNAEDASHSLNAKSVVYDYDSLKKIVVELAGLYGKKALVEEYIDGREFNMTVMGNAILTPLPFRKSVLRCLRACRKYSAMKPSGIPKASITGERCRSVRQT